MLECPPACWDSGGVVDGGWLPISAQAATGSWSTPRVGFPGHRTAQSMAGRLLLCTPETHSPFRNGRKVPRSPGANGHRRPQAWCRCGCKRPWAPPGRALQRSRAGRGMSARHGGGCTSGWAEGQNAGSPPQLGNREIKSAITSSSHLPSCLMGPGGNLLLPRPVWTGGGLLCH